MQKLIIIGLFLFCTVAAFAKENLDSLEKLTGSYKGEELYNLYEKLYRGYINTDTAKSWEYINLSYKLAQRLNDNGKILTSITAKAFYNDYLGNYDDAIKYYEQALNVSFNTDSSKARFALNNLSIIYKNRAEYDKALNYSNLNLELSLRDSNYESIANAYITIANIYVSNHKFDIYLKYLRKALYYTVKGNNTEKTGIIHGNIGVYFYQESKWDSALAYYLKAKDVFIKFNNYQTASLLNHIAICYMNLGDFSAAKDYIAHSEKVADAVNIPEVKYDINTAKAKYLAHFGRIDEGIALLKESLEYYYTKNQVKNYKVTYFDIIELYLKKSDYKNAYKFQKELFDLTAKTTKEDFQKAIAEYDIKMNVTEKELENVRLKTENLQREKERNLTFIVSIIVILLLIIIIFWLRQVKKLNRMLEDKNRKLEISENNLKEANATKDKFFSIIAHDLKNPIHGFKQIADLLYTEFDNLNELETRELTLEIKNSSTNVVNLLENLLEWSKSQRGITRFMPDNINLRDLANNNLDILEPMARNKDIALDNKVVENHIIYADMNMINTAIRNIATNAIKFTEKDGKVTIASDSDDENNYLIIQDNGTGMSDKQKSNLFRIDKSNSTPGTNDEKGTGLGLIIVKDFIDKHQGTIQVESEVGKGSKFTIILPKLIK